jgi:hypothetical protein
MLLDSKKRKSQKNVFSIFFILAVVPAQQSHLSFCTPISWKHQRGSHSSRKNHLRKTRLSLSLGGQRFAIFATVQRNTMLQLLSVAAGAPVQEPLPFDYWVWDWQLLVGSLVFIIGGSMSASVGIGGCVN